jgi:hypothetical protein
MWILKLVFFGDAGSFTIFTLYSGSGSFKSKVIGDGAIDTFGIHLGIFHSFLSRW